MACALRRALSREVSSADPDPTNSAPAAAHWALSPAHGLGRSESVAGLQSRSRSALVTKAELHGGLPPGVAPGLRPERAGSSSVSTHEWLAAQTDAPPPAAVARTTDSQRVFSQMLLESDRYTLLRNLCKWVLSCRTRLDVLNAIFYPSVV